MSECMTQEDAMNMSTEQAIQILKPMQSMMRDQHGCPISDAYFALGKAIEALEQKADAVERKKGKWIYADDVFEDAVCSSCKWDSGETMQHARKTFKFCPNCGAEMRGETDEFTGDICDDIARNL